MPMEDSKKSDSRRNSSHESKEEGLTPNEKRKALRAGLAAKPGPVVAIGAHDAMSAMLAERHGFDAIWVSGFGVSTMAHALPDLNLTTMSEALAAAQRIDAAVGLPVVADCDNGFGSAGNLLRTAREYERAGISGICVEDNVFPKRNSLYQGKAVRELIPVEEQSRRIRLAKEAQRDSDFVFIARVEALIAGHGVEAALERADAFLAAGADAILIHSKDKSLAEIDEFLGRWDHPDVPLVAVPTLFPVFTGYELSEKGFIMVILANHLMRASVQAMTETLETLAKEKKAAAVDGSITPVNDIFKLVDTEGGIAVETPADSDSG
jgi:phosphoenolpyruvate phosphomutase